MLKANRREEIWILVLLVPLRNNLCCCWWEEILVVERCAGGPLKLAKALYLGRDMAIRSELKEDWQGCRKAKAQQELLSETGSTARESRGFLSVGVRPSIAGPRKTSQNGCKTSKYDGKGRKGKERQARSHSGFWWARANDRATPTTSRNKKNGQG